MSKLYVFSGLFAERVSIEVVADDEDEARDKIMAFKYESLEPDDNEGGRVIRDSLEVVDIEDDYDEEEDDDDEWEDDDE